jgi:hypothetical protein
MDVDVNCVFPQIVETEARTCLIVSRLVCNLLRRFPSALAALPHPVLESGWSTSS